MITRPIDLTLLAKKRDGSGHSIFSPSSSAMWLTCSGSLIANVLCNDEAGVDAAYGTVAHELTEWSLKNGYLPTHRIGETVWVESGDWGFLIKIDEEMLEYVQQAVDYCEWLPGEHFVEQRVYFSEYTPLERQSGTCDHCACDGDTMIITDHKFGKGIVVYAAMDHDDPRGVIINDIDDSFVLNGNPQGLMYALGFFLKHDPKYNFKRIIIRISQPRLNHFDEWTTTREELLKFAAWVKIRADLAWVVNAPRTPSPKGCLWCKVATECTAYTVMQEDLFSGAMMGANEEVTVERMGELKARLDDEWKPYEMTIADVNSLSIENMATLLKYRPVAEAWWKKLEDSLFRAAARGERVAGYKLVESRARRVFKNQTAAVKRLVDDLGLPRREVVVEKLVSPAQAELLLIKKGRRKKEMPALLEGLVHKPPGNPTLVPAYDRRPELSRAADHAFDDLPLNSENPDSEEI